MAGKRGEGKTTTMTGADWQRILRIMDEAYQQHLTGMVALRERVVADLRRKLSDGKVLDRPDLEQPLPRERAASAARHRRPRARRPRG